MCTLRATWSENFRSDCPRKNCAMPRAFPCGGAFCHRLRDGLAPFQWGGRHINFYRGFHAETVSKIDMAILWKPWGGLENHFGRFRGATTDPWNLHSKEWQGDNDDNRRGFDAESTPKIRCVHMPYKYVLTTVFDVESVSNSVSKSDFTPPPIQLNEAAADFSRHGFETRNVKKKKKK